jgi:hypothetical protein
MPCVGCRHLLAGFDDILSQPALDRVLALEQDPNSFLDQIAQ